MRCTTSWHHLGMAQIFQRLLKNKLKCIIVWFGFKWKKQSPMGHKVAQCHNTVHNSGIVQCNPVLLIFKKVLDRYPCTLQILYLLSVFASVLRRVIPRAPILYTATAYASGLAAMLCSETSSHSSSESTALILCVLLCCLSCLQICEEEL